MDIMCLAAEADACRAYAQSVIVLKGARLVGVVEPAELERVALDEGILAKEVRDVDLLVAHIDLGELDRVQLAVGVFLEHVEHRQVVLIPVRPDVAEHPRAEVRVAEDKASKIAGEFLDAHAHRGRIEERRTTALAPFAAQERYQFRRIAQTPFEEHSLDGVESVDARLAFAHILIDDAVFARPQIIDVRNEGCFEPPVNRFERSVAFEHVEGHDEILVDEILPAATEKFKAAGKLAADVLRHRQPAEVEEALAGERQVHENVVADDRVTAFQTCLAIGVEDAALGEARVFRDAYAPPIFNYHETGVFRAGLLAPRPTRRAQRLIIRQSKPRPVARVWARALRRLSRLLGLILD